MFKKQTPRKPVAIPQFPHCDARILHAPGECRFCDAHPEWQALRQAWGICFTGYDPEDNELPCPAEHARGRTSVNAWGGNVARPQLQEDIAATQKPVDKG